MTDLEILKAARELIADEQKWCQGTAARDKGGRYVVYSSPEAARFCAVGALWRVQEERDNYGLTDLLWKKSYELFDLPLATANDIIGHEAIMQVFDKVILEMEEYVD